MNELTTAAINLLKDLIATPSFSQEEEKTADRIGKWLDKYSIPFRRVGNNIWAQNKLLIQKTNPFAQFSSRYCSAELSLYQRSF